MSNIKRKRVLITDSEYQFVFTYGVLHKIESEVASGGSVLVIGISGTGKSTILDKMPTSGATVFQLGGTLDPSRPKHHVFTVAQAEEMIRQAKKTKGRKILIAHELFIGPKMLEELGDFDQFAFVGDPMQPGSCADAEHLFQFMRDIGGKTFTLSVVWRASNPLSMMSLNYLAYGSKYKICTRNFSLDDRQFEIIVCDDNVTVIAANLLTHALKKAKDDRSVMIGAGSQELINALKSLLAHVPNCPDSIRCRHLTDLQGREADVLIIDVHDVAVSYPESDDALRFFYMLLGRARHTTVFALGKRNMCSDPQLALPVEVYAGVVLRHRVRSTEAVSLKYVGNHFQQLEKTYNLVLFDEETIAMMLAASGVTYIILIKNRHSHNALMLKDLYLVIEATEFFVKAENVDRQCELLNYFVGTFYLPPKGRVYSFPEIHSFISSHKK